MIIKRFTFFVIGAVVLLLSFPFSFAQEESKDQLYVIHEEVAKADMIDLYEKTSKEWVEMMYDAGLDIPSIYASQRDDFHYYYLIPIKNYAEIDGIPQKFQDAAKKLDKDKWSKLTSENDKSIETHREFVAKWSAELSYEPKEPRLKPEERKFIHWVFFQYKLDKRKEVMEVIKEWKKLYTDKKINHGYSIWLIDLGEQNNVIVLTEYAKDGVDYYRTMDEITKMVGQEEQKLQAKFLPLVTKIEQKYGSTRSDLGYYKK